MNKVKKSPDPYDIDYCEYEKINEEDCTDSDFELESIKSDIDENENANIQNQFIEETNNNYSFINNKSKIKKKSQKDKVIENKCNELEEESYLSET